MVERSPLVMRKLMPNVPAGIDTPNIEQSFLHIDHLDVSIPSAPTLKSDPRGLKVGTYVIYVSKRNSIYRLEILKMLTGLE